MSGMQDRFEARVHHFAQLQRKLNERLRDFERRKAEKPFLCADEAWATTQGMLGYLRKQSIHLFGLDVEHYGPLILSSALEPAEDEPESVESITPLCGSTQASAFAVFFVKLYMDYKMVSEAMASAYRRSDIWGSNVAECVCELYAQLLSERPRHMFAAIEIVQNRFPRVARRAALAEALTGYFDTILSFKGNRRMARGVFAEKAVEESLHQARLRELPAEALRAWDERGYEDLKELRNQIAERLSHLGRESSFKENLVDLPAGMPEKGEEDALIEELELRETMHQQRQQLDTLREQALKHAPQQQAVFQRRREGMKIAKIAAELGIPRNQVYVQYHNAVQKLIEARKAAGL